MTCECLALQHNVVVVVLAELLSDCNVLTALGRVPGHYEVIDDTGVLTVRCEYLLICWLCIGSSCACFGSHHSCSVVVFFFLLVAFLHCLCFDTWNA